MSFTQFLNKNNMLAEQFNSGNKVFDSWFEKSKYNSFTADNFKLLGEVFKEVAFDAWEGGKTGVNFNEWWQSYSKKKALDVNYLKHQFKEISEDAFHKSLSVALKRN